MYHITKIYKHKPKDRKYLDILIGIKDESMSKEILLKACKETGEITPEPDKIDILIKEFREFKNEMIEFKNNQEQFNHEMIEFKTNQEQFNQMIVNRLDNLVKKNNLKE